MKRVYVQKQSVTWKAVVWCIVGRKPGSNTLVGELAAFMGLVNPFQRLCSRRIFENIVTKEEIAQYEQFLLLPPCFHILVIGYPFNYRDFLFFDKICLKSSSAELSY